MAGTENPPFSLFLNVNGESRITKHMKKASYINSRDQNGQANNWKEVEAMHGRKIFFLKNFKKKPIINIPRKILHP